MTFEAFMAAQNLTDGQMAEIIGCDRSYVLKLRNGKVPSPSMIRKIAEKTGGEVQFDDWFDQSAPEAA